MTAPDAPEGQPGSAKKSVLPDGFQGEFGTGRIKAAISAEPEPQRQLVQPDQSNPH